MASSMSACYEHSAQDCTCALLVVRSLGMLCLPSWTDGGRPILANTIESPSLPPLLAVALWQVPKFSKHMHGVACLAQVRDRAALLY